VSEPLADEHRHTAPDLPWYVYDRHATLLHVADTLQQAEAWAFDHWDVVEVADREQVADNDFFYLLLAAESRENDFHARDFQARIIRKDRVIAIGRDPDAAPRHPTTPPTTGEDRENGAKG
jgi:hypothetical protein